MRKIMQRYAAICVACFMGLSGAAHGSTGGTAEGMDIGYVLCKNRDNDQSERLYPQGTYWDCEAGGMQVRAGDRITQKISGKALSATADIHGTAVGITNIKALYCKNRSTGKVRGQRYTNGVMWSCGDAGLRVSAGNRVDVVIVGPAQGPVPPAPSGLGVKGGAGQAALSWSAIPDVNSYNVYMSTEPFLKPSPETLLATVAVNTYAATGLVNGVEYYFAVTAENAYGESAPSTEISVVPGYFDHNTVPGQPCANCHDLPLLHPLTSSMCEACHDVAAWKPLIMPMDHGQTADTCVRCHNGLIANAKAATHPVTTDYCEACHMTIAWLPLVTPMDHSQTSDTCLTCHNGTIASGKSAAHAITTDQCESCHTPASWLPLILPFDHSGVLAPTCLGGGCHGPMEMGPAHCPTKEDCVACHSTPSWFNAQAC